MSGIVNIAQYLAPRAKAQRLTLVLPATLLLGACRVFPHASSTPPPPPYGFSATRTPAASATAAAAPPAMTGYVENPYEDSFADTDLKVAVQGAPQARAPELALPNPYEAGVPVLAVANPYEAGAPVLAVANPYETGATVQPSPAASTGAAAAAQPVQAAPASSAQPASPAFEAPAPPTGSVGASSVRLVPSAPAPSARLPNTLFGFTIHQDMRALRRNCGRQQGTWRFDSDTCETSIGGVQGVVSRTENGFEFIGVSPIDSRRAAGSLLSWLYETYDEPLAKGESRLLDGFFWTWQFTDGTVHVVAFGNVVSLDVQKKR